MSEHAGDERLRRAFDALRAADGARAPAFGSTIASARARRSRSGHRRVLLAAAAILGAAAITSWLPSAFPSRRPPSERVAASGRTAWTATPTDFLLDAPGAELLTDVPRLDESVLDLPASSGWITLETRKESP